MTPVKEYANRHLASRFIVLLTCFIGLAEAAAPVAGYKVFATYPHSTGTYMQGFFYLDGFFYEAQDRKALVSNEHQTGNRKVLQRIVDWNPNIDE